MTESVDRLLELELKTAAQASKPFATPLARLLALLVALWPGDNASAAAKQAVIDRLDLDAFLDGVPEAMFVIQVGTLAALQEGLTAGAEGLDVQTPAFKHTLPVGLGVKVTTTESLAKRAVARGVALLGVAETLDQAQAAVALANPAQALAAHARTLTNEASNEGIISVAQSVPYSVVVWQAERDGCVDCLAYQGQTRKGGSYPAGLTFGKKPLRNDKVASPPLHPNCRCTQVVLHRETAQPVIAGLLREAKRSVLRGWSVESESEAVRVDAARRLLAKGTTLPKSVQAYARDAVKTGAFARGREFPGA